MLTARKLIAAAVLTLLASAAWALEVDEVIRMSKAKAGDEVIVAQIKAAGARFALTADEIIRLKKEGVSDAVVKTMIESGGEKRAEPASREKSREEVAKDKKEPERVEEPAGGGLGTLILENLDSRDYSVQVDAGHGNIFYYKAVNGQGRDRLPARSSLVYRLSAGRYTLRWVGQAESHTVNVLGEKTSRAVLTRTSGEDFEAAYLSLFEDGNRRGGGRLVKLVDRSPAESVRSAAAPQPPVVEKHYYYAPQTCAVQAPATYYRPRSSRYRSSRGYRNNWLLPAFAYTWKRGKSRYAVGWGPSGGVGFSYGRKLGRSGYVLNFGW